MSASGRHSGFRIISLDYFIRMSRALVDFSLRKRRRAPEAARQLSCRLNKQKLMTDSPVRCKVGFRLLDRVRVEHDVRKCLHF